ncbi:hypothetical protein Pmani_014293 [Petrolisthes manimaculis]|uniref:Uncharacterized protein n=1 Tax=Petrolisthes manimaculis TaxID=1843537 RepID=A0AAE1PF50_9EUCA|nr:hypothetical protein Pmani_020946 [Petrolisthes manimaculis]KAK4314406.1 hypothetical protein Pmani_014293 [Petrolisthes manimaculis]
MQKVQDCQNSFVSTPVLSASTCPSEYAPTTTTYHIEREREEGEPNRRHQYPQERPQHCQPHHWRQRKQEAPRISLRPTTSTYDSSVRSH